MQKPSEQQATDEAPLYIRWNPDRSPYAIELKLDLVSKILNEMAQAQRVGIEVGGILIGALPAEYAPTLRIDDVEMVPRSPDDGPIYMLDPGQHERFSQIRWKPRAAGRVAIGFFRSHLRPGSLRPSLADRSLLSAEFKQPVYAVLLIQGAEPRTAAFFLATNGRFSEEPAVREFRFDESGIQLIARNSGGSSAAGAKKRDEAAGGSPFLRSNRRIAPDRSGRVCAALVSWWADSCSRNGSRRGLAWNLRSRLEIASCGFHGTTQQASSHTHRAAL